ncbi:hypothetical protein [Actinotalea sp. Marseille-Q4924]|uniref:hypothetical protein n=1 Tax=Actinotalea sp. Marseille-Q4924 TaxID=2866571 RepID=UPI001CE42AB5|nr:hypothetical protein [Actinotalea sp. Marseille-Q4924]
MTVQVTARRDPVPRPVLLPGWSARSRWGWDPALECYWARLVPLRRDGAVLEVSREHLVPTLASLARTVAARAALDDGLVFVALTGGIVPGTPPAAQPRPGRRTSGSRPSLEGR